MSIKKKILKQIGDYLMRTLQTYDPVDYPDGVFTPEDDLPGLQWFDKQMGQFRNPQTATAMPLPCILMKFEQFSWLTVGQNQQRGTGSIRFDVYFENYADSFNGSINQDLALRFFEFTEKVNLVLQGLVLPDMPTGLDRVSDNEDEEEDMIITSTVSYSTTLLDTTTDTRRHLQIVDPEVKVKYKKQTERPARDKFIDTFVIS